MTTTSPFTAPASSAGNNPAHILHLVELTWNPGVDQTSVDGLTRDLQLMASELDMIRYFSCGPALHVRPDGADYAIVVGTDSEEDLLDYLAHPLHTQTLHRWAASMVREKQSIQIVAALPGLTAAAVPITEAARYKGASS